MAENPNTGEMLRTTSISTGEVDAAVDAAIGKPDVKPYSIGGGYLLNLGAVLKAHEPAATVLAAPSTMDAVRKDQGAQHDPAGAAGEGLIRLSHATTPWRPPLALVVFTTFVAVVPWIVVYCITDRIVWFW